MGAGVPWKRLGRYDLIGLLATGGMAEIFLARQEGPAGFERPVVIKRVLPHLAREREFRDMFLDEAKIVSRLHHPNVVGVHELGDAESELFLVMEYLEGENLASVLKYVRKSGEPLPVRLAAHIAAEVAGGLHAAHELADENGKRLDIVHRDVSPHNVFVLYAGEVKVIDFGIAKALDRQAGRTRTGQVKGKFAYMAPEQIVGEQVDRRADVFALGAVLHELLTGKKLFARDHDLLVLKAVCEEPILPPSATRPDVPKEIDAIVMRALQRRPGARFESAAAMRRELVMALRSMPADDLPEEALAALMARHFSERIAKQQDMLRRMRSGQTITHVPTAEPTGSELTPPPPHAEPEPTSRTSAVSPGQTISVEAPAPKKRVWPIVATAAAVAAIGGAAFWGITRKPATDLAAAARPSAPATAADDDASGSKPGPSAATPGASPPASADRTGEASPSASAAAAAIAPSASTGPHPASAPPASKPPPVGHPVAAPPPAKPAGSTGGFTRFD